MAEIVIRENIPQYLSELKAWLEDVKDVHLEEMSDFFHARLDGYEEHMQIWHEAYVHMAEILPENAQKLLDLGCGTGLELDEIFRLHPDVQVTGVDLAESMLGQLKRKHPQVNTICADYFACDLGEAEYDAVISFESLHHFKPEKKQTVYDKAFAALKPGGIFLLADYIACCNEEETLLMDTCDRRRAQQGINPEIFVHFDTPLTAEHEMALFRAAGFVDVEVIASIEGATFIRGRKPEQII